MRYIDYALCRNVMIWLDDVLDYAKRADASEAFLDMVQSMHRLVSDYAQKLHNRSETL